MPSSRHGPSLWPRSLAVGRTRSCDRVLMVGVSARWGDGSARLGAGVAEPLEHARLEGTGW